MEEQRTIYDDYYEAGVMPGKPPRSIFYGDVKRLIVKYRNWLLEIEGRKDQPDFNKALDAYCDLESITTKICQLIGDEERLVDLIEDALAHFGHSKCPHCGVGISLEQYIDQMDIKKWLQEREA